jgi:hypothetical protein
VKIRGYLSKRQLVSTLERDLRGLGYEPVPGPLPSGASGLLYKRLGELVLTLGIEISELHEQRFTGSFYLSRTFTWALVFRDFPPEAYARVGSFLLERERNQLLTEEFCEPGVEDAWWIGFTEDAARSFTEAIRNAEPRFVSQEGLREAVLSSEGPERQARLVDRALVESARHDRRPQSLEHQPKRYPKKVPEKWFWASELALSASGAIPNEKTVVRLAVDAWRTALLLRQGEGPVQASD